VQRKKNQWYVDSGCSKHMTGDQSRFLVLNREKGGNATFGNYVSTKIIGKRAFILGNEKDKVENVFLIEYMKHNILNVSQMCDQGHIPTFDSKKCEIIKKKMGRLVATTL